jgi:cysteine-rich repeat protein
MLGLIGVSVALFEACSLDTSGLPGGVGGSGGSSVSSSASGGTEERCGDGQLTMSEACDDGNTAPGDGCSPTCTTEQPDTCPGVAVPLDPTGITLQVDLTNTKDDLHPGCTTMDGGDVSYAVTPTATGTLTVTLSGDAPFRRSLAIRSICTADLPATEITCGAGETADPIVLHAWVIQGMTYHVIVDGEPHAFSLSLGLDPCGDGKLEELEQCDGEPGCKGCVTCTGPGEFWAPTSARCYRFVETAATWVDAR